ncbi:MAG: cysteine--tRNA ligase [Candidatus Nanoarchaeia archaeon]|nr:cysteine--tRNA ligase [Candidatus Nanoarchaeia archaeon]
MLKFYNTLTRKIEEFKPLNKSKVNIYSCGPTIYSYVHLGNLRAFLFYDLLRRYLKYKGFKVKQVMNITDVDDKTIKGANDEKMSLKEFTEKYEKLFFEDLKKLNVETFEYYPRATEHIKEMVKIVQILLKNGYAYKTDDGIYFSVAKFDSYGNLTGQKLKQIEAGIRIKKDEYDKEEAHDFALWKFWDETDGDVFWETEVGKGRPGWHLECSAMSMKYLGKTLDIHTGGIDLIFPHHQNEIAQSEASTGKPFVNYWMHNEHLMVEGKKMSKSLGNLYTLKDLEKKGYNPKVIRYELISSHYRQRSNFTFKGLDASKNAIDKLTNFVELSKGKKDGEIIGELIKKAKTKFEEAMDEDLNISEGLAVIFEFVKEANKIGAGKKACKAIMEFDEVLGILSYEKEDVPEEIKEIAKEREEARTKKDWKTSDKLRDEIKNKGYSIEDLDTGYRLKKI